jgi:hypothetical protein
MPMKKHQAEIKQIASQILAGMLANPHIYATISEEESRGQQEQTLILTAIGMAEKLIDRVENREPV